jgi:hypothetical protein
MESVKQLFIHSLGQLKVIMIILLVVISIMYNIIYHNKTDTNTLLHISPGRVILDTLLAGVGGIITLLFIGWSRNYLHNLSLKIFFVIFIILALFTFAQESSGFNRFLSKADIIKGKGIYGSYYEKHKINLSELVELEKNGDPFLISLAYLFIVVVGGVILYYSGVLLHLTYKGLKENIGSIPSINCIFNINPSNNLYKYLLFILETLIVLVINGLPILFSPYIRGEENKIQIKPTQGLILILIIAFHLMFQFTGLNNL